MLKGVAQSFLGGVFAVLLLVLLGAGGDGKVTSNDKADFVRGLSPWRTYIHDIMDEITEAKGSYNLLKDKLDAMQSGPLSAIQWTASGQTPTFVDSDTFTVPTDMTDKFDAGRRVKAELVAGNFVYSNVSSSSFASSTTTVNVDTTNLTSSLSAVSYSFLDAGSDHSLPTDAGVPKNGIILMTDATCPAGFAEYTAARGYYLVGVPSGGTNAGTVGSAMTDLQNLTHTHTGPSHTHTYTDIVNHVHSVDPPSTSVAVTDPQHKHGEQMKSVAGGNTATSAGGSDATADGTSTAGNNASTGITASVNIAAFDSANPTGGVATGTTAAGGTGATGTASTSSVAPYFQIRLCQKS